MRCNKRTYQVWSLEFKNIRWRRLHSKKNTIMMWRYLDKLKLILKKNEKKQVNYLILLEAHVFNDTQDSVRLFSKHWIHQGWVRGRGGQQNKYNNTGSGFIEMSFKCALINQKLTATYLGCQGVCFAKRLMSHSWIVSILIKFFEQRQTEHKIKLIFIFPSLRKVLILGKT